MGTNDELREGSPRPLLEQPYYKYQQQGYFPWEASFDGSHKPLIEEINIILSKIPDIDQNRDKKLQAFLVEAMQFSANIYNLSFSDSQNRPVYHGINPKAGTAEALMQPTCGHGEAAMLATMTAYMGACINGHEFREDEFKLLALVALVHEGFSSIHHDWYGEKLNEKLTLDFLTPPGHNLSSISFGVAYGLNLFGKPGEYAVNKALTEHPEVTNRRDELLLWSNCLRFGDWAGQVLNPSYLNAITCLPDEFQIHKPNYIPQEWRDSSGQLDHTLVTLSPSFYHNYALPGFEAGLELTDFFFGGSEQNLFRQNDRKLRERFSITNPNSLLGVWAPSLA